MSLRKEFNSFSIWYPWWRWVQEEDEIAISESIANAKFW